MKKKDRLKQVSPERDVEYYSLNFQELSTVLAALRVFQRVRNLNSPDQCWRVEQMEHFETVKPLTDGEIDSLCERINYSKSRACVRWRKYVQAAKQLFHVEGEIEVDDSALVSEGDDHGAHVQAWVWVPVEEIRKKRQGVRP